MASELFGHERGASGRRPAEGGFAQADGGRSCSTRSPRCRPAQAKPCACRRADVRGSEARGDPWRARARRQQPRPAAPSAPAPFRRPDLRPQRITIEMPTARRLDDSADGRAPRRAADERHNALEQAQQGRPRSLKSHHWHGNVRELRNVIERRRHSCLRRANRAPPPRALPARTAARARSEDTSRSQSDAHGSRRQRILRTSRRPEQKPRRRLLQISSDAQQARLPRARPIQDSNRRIRNSRPGHRVD